MDGSAGADILSGGLGNDSMTGGSGNDVFVFSAAPAPETDTVVEVSAAGPKAWISVPWRATTR